MKKFQFNKQTDSLFEAILILSTVKEAEAFFRDLCTIEELQEMTDRWQIVILLNQGLSYRAIAEKIKVSTTTVNRVATWLNNGMNGYKSVFERLNNHHLPSLTKKGSR